MQEATRSRLSRELHRGIDACTASHRACTEALAYCIAKGGVHAEPAHLRLLMDTAEICQTNANFMMRNSDLHSRTCTVAGLICERCAQSCERLGEDEQMKACAAVCRQAMQVCKELGLA